jgi:hypothetical protein
VRVGRADDVEDDPAGPRQAEAPVAQRIDRLVRNNYQLLVEPQRTCGGRRVSSARRLARSEDFQ